MKKLLQILFLALIASGCNAQKQNEDKFERAIRYGDLKTVTEMVESGIVDANKFFDDDRYQGRPIHVAAYYGRDEIIVYLAKKDVDINAIPLTGKTPLMTAIRKNRESTALLLLKLGADPSIPNSAGVSTCTMAKRSNLPKVVAALPGCDPTPETRSCPKSASC